MLRYPTYMAVETLTIAMVTEDGQSFEDLGIEERKEGQVIIKCRAAEPMRDGAPCEWNKMGSDGYPFCASSTEVMRLREYNAKLRERAVAMLSELRGVVSEGDYDSPSGRYFLLRKDVAAYEDALRELGIEVDE